MSEILQKSAVLPWGSDLQSVPAEKGLYVLRDLPTINGIIYIDYADNLREAFKTHLDSQDIPDVAWFDWYTVQNEDAGRNVLKQWIAKYLPKYNMEVES